MTRGVAPDVGADGESIAFARQTARFVAALVPWVLSLAVAPWLAAAPQEPAGSAIDGPPAPVPPATISRDTNGRATVRAVRLDAPLRLDGVLDEAIYAGVQPFGDFIQQSPDEGAPASEPTDAWIFFDDQSIYVAARIWESVPESEWVANEMQRDSFQIINNDGFIVVFDTFYDRRNGFAFRVNPIGGFSDRQITDEGNPNSDWNPVWDVRTGRFEGGWTVEMVVPFKSLRFPRGASQVWGIQLGRDIRSTFEEAYLTAVPISAGPGQFRLSAAGTPRWSGGAGGQPHVRDQALRDRLACHRPDRRAPDPECRRRGGGRGRQVRTHRESHGGLHLEHRFRAGRGGRAADQPDAVQPVFPEKREFFLESQGIFDFGRVAGFGGLGGSGRGSFAGGPGSFGGGDVPTIFFSRQIGLDQRRTVRSWAAGV